MGNNRLIKNGLIIIAVLALLIVLTLSIPFKAPSGNGDFQAYWSASYLLAHSQNFTDLDLLLEIEQTKTGWTNEFVMSTWNPPWLLVMLIPYTLVPFQQAAWLWLFTNVGLVFTASLFIWRVFDRFGNWRKREWVALLAAFLFVPTLLALVVGQVNTLVFFGLAGFLFFYTEDKPFTAGALLSFTLVKPHLVYVMLPIILLIVARKGQWRVWFGLVAAILLMTGIAFGLRPTFVMDYGRSMAAANLISWQTPTLGGVLMVMFGWNWSKWMGMIILPIIAVLWYWRPERFPFLTWFHGTLLISVITAPFGWGYDAIVLLLPILQMVYWVVSGQFDRWKAGFITFFLILINLFLFWQRMQGINEVYYFWLPVAVAGLYIWSQINPKASSHRLQIST